MGKTWIRHASANSQAFLRTGDRRLVHVSGVQLTSTGSNLSTGLRRFDALELTIALVITNPPTGQPSKTHGRLKMGSNTTVVDLSSSPGTTTMDNSPTFLLLRPTQAKCTCFRTQTC